MKPANVKKSAYTTMSVCSFSTFAGFISSQKLYIMPIEIGWITLIHYKNDVYA